MKKEKMKQKIETADSSLKSKNERDTREILNKINKKEIDFKDLNKDQRDVIIYNFNNKEENKNISQLENEKPDMTFIKNAEKEYKDALKAPTELNFDFVVDKVSPEDLAAFLKHWNLTYAGVENDEWRGLLYFDDFIKDRMENLKNKKEKKLILNFNALLYLDTIFRHPKGTGFEFAKWMKKNEDLYKKISDGLETHMNKVMLMNKKAALYKAKWYMALNGFKMKILISKIEDFAKITNDQIPR